MATKKEPKIKFVDLTVANTMVTYRVTFKVESREYAEVIEGIIGYADIIKEEMEVEV